MDKKGDDALIESYHQLCQGQCANPFSVLGFHDVGKQLVLRVWQPDAEAIELLDDENRSIGFMRLLYDRSLFELKVKGTLRDKLYALRIINKKGEFFRQDPYQFKQQAYYGVHYIDHAPQNLYRQGGAQICQQDVGGKVVLGTRFSVYAPNASSVSLIGDFNWWDGQYLPMQSTDLGYWVLFVPGLDAGQRYKFELRNSAGRVLPHKADPLGFHAEQYPSHASIIYDHDQYQWQDQHWQERTPVNLYESPMSIYEVHLGSWQRQYHGEKSEYFSYRELALKLVNYVLEMGFTHIELMPISEYPFDGSWGYQPIGMFAPTSRFGDPDDFKYFVDQFHQAGIGVIVDWVPAHFPADEHGLGTFDGTSLFEHIDPRKGWHPDWDSYVYDFGNPFVRQFLVANALYWCERFHIDGIRVDAVASMLYLDYSRSAGEWLPNSDGSNVNYDAISLLQWLNTEVYLQHPKALTIAEESTSFAKVSAPVHLGGLGFGFKWNMGWMNDSLAYMATPHDLRSEQHDGLTFSLVYAWDENFILPLSHDEVVHGKGSLLYKMQGDEWQQGANLRAYLGFMYGHPGKKLNFMGNEIAQGAEWNHDDSIQWHLLAFEKHQGVQELFKKLNSLYCEKTALHQLDHEPAGFAWMDINSAALSLVAFVRRDKHGQKVYCISNFTPAPVYGYRLPVEDKGQFSLILNTDHRQYWGSGFTQDKAFISQDIAWHGQAQSICFDMPPLATIFIEYSGNA